MADIAVGESEFHHTDNDASTIEIEGDIHVAGLSSDEEDQSTLDEPISTTLVSNCKIFCFY